MLPILRIIPVGGVLLAIMILALALSPPGGPYPGLAPTVVSARGAMMQQDEHPQWRHFLILAATRRADELSRLRDLPGMPARNDSAQDAGKFVGKFAGKFAGLPASRSDADPNDETGTIADVPAMNMPVEIGETSSTELPMTAPEDRPPVVKSPGRAKAPKDSRPRATYRVRHARARAKPKAVVEFNLFEIIFGGALIKQTAAGNAQTIQPAASIQN